MNRGADVALTVVTLLRTVGVFVRVGLAVGLFLSVFFGLLGAPVLMMAGFLAVYVALSYVHRRQRD